MSELVQISGFLFKFNENELTWCCHRPFSICSESRVCRRKACMVAPVCMINYRYYMVIHCFYRLTPGGRGPHCPW